MAYFQSSLNQLSMKKLVLAFVGMLTISLGTYAQQKKQPGIPFVKGTAPCSTVDPPKNFLLDTTDLKGGRGLADNFYLWDVGSILYVKIWNGSPQMRQMIQAYAKEWEKYANIKFQFVETGDAHIRVLLDNKGGNNSRIGIQALSVPQDQKTMNLDTTTFKTAAYTYTCIVHEFGHAIGLLHEHSSPISGIKWNKDYVYAELKRTNGWDRDAVDWNLFKTVNQFYTNGTTYDRYSIMHYPIMPGWTTNSYVVNWNNAISEGDKNLMRILYPASGARSTEVPRLYITKPQEPLTLLNVAKMGVSIFPRFAISSNINTSAFIVAYVYDEFNRPVTYTDATGKSMILCTYQSVNLEGNKSYTVNNGTNRDFELFIPQAEILKYVPSGNVKISVQVLVSANNELKNFYVSELKSMVAK